MKLGIGVTTFDRRGILGTSLSRLRQFTTQPFSLVVADDGSSDGTAAMCHEEGITCVTGENMGIAWNKNRALFFLHQVLRCDVVILFEDDCCPNELDWQADWVDAAKNWGHINFAAEWCRDGIIDGDGTPAKPFLSKLVGGQCTAFSRAALSTCGYMDSRFRAYGYEHAEHSARLVRAGFGGEMRMAGRGEVDPHFYLLKAKLAILESESYCNQASITANWAAWEKMYGDPIYRYPWKTRKELAQFRCEITGTETYAKLSIARRLLLAANWERWRQKATKD